MTSVCCVPVSQVDFSAFTTTFNQAYSDYHVPISMTIQSFQALIERDDLDLDASVAALDGDRIIGTGLLGVRDRHGWIGGMGVIPTRRRQGIGRQMMYYLLEQARKRNLASVNLEVIEANTGAHALYRQLDFVEQRYLLILEREMGPVEPFNNRYHVEERAVNSLLEFYNAFHIVPNCWQRSLHSLHALTSYLQGWAVLEADTVVGYAVGWASDYGVRLTDIAADPDRDSVTIAQALLSELHRQNDGASGSSYNIAENDPVVSAYEALGYKTAFRQIEMRYNIEPTGS
jgi:ribosomal protein S18 acetylase RimI-like enzyme